MAVSLAGLALLAAPASAQTVPAPPAPTEWRKPAFAEPPALPSLTPLPPAPMPASPPRLDEVFRPQTSPTGSSGWKPSGVRQAVQNVYQPQGQPYPPIPGGPIQQVVQRPAQGAEGTENVPLLDPPSAERLFLRLDSERNLRERMRQEALSRPEPSRIIFPEEPVVSRERYLGRRFPLMVERVEPGYVMYRRLLFEQKNAERYGWSYGYLHPLVSAAVFYKDLVMLPYHIGTRPFQQWETDAGYALPGDPQPLLLYPEELSLTGLAAEAAAVTGMFFIFP
jgi:hypothetical protein